MKYILTLLAIFGCISPPVKNSKPKPKHMVKCENPDPIVVAVIDTGFGYHHDYGNGCCYYNVSKKLCKFGHKDFSHYNLFHNKLNDAIDPVPQDTYGHGTNIASVIEKYAGNSNFCMVIIKYYDPHIRYDGTVLSNLVESNKKKKNIKVDMINISGGGAYKSEEEIKVVKEFLDQGGTIIAAAGNESENLHLVPFYPAMDDDRVIVVGNIDKYGNRKSNSNYGDRVSRWEIGHQTANGLTMDGTSQSTAVATGKIIKAKKCKNFVDDVSK